MQDGMSSSKLSSESMKSVIFFSYDSQAQRCEKRYAKLSFNSQQLFQFWTKAEPEKEIIVRFYSNRMVWKNNRKKCRRKKTSKYWIADNNLRHCNCKTVKIDQTKIKYFSLRNKKKNESPSTNPEKKTLIQLNLNQTTLFSSVSSRFLVFWHCQDIHTHITVR